MAISDDNRGRPGGPSLSIASPATLSPGYLTLCRARLSAPCMAFDHLLFIRVMAMEMPVTFIALGRFNLLARDKRRFAVHGCLRRLGCRRAPLRHRVTGRKGFVQRIVALVGLAVSLNHHTPRANAALSLSAIFGLRSIRPVGSVQHATGVQP